MTTHREFICKLGKYRVYQYANGGKFMLCNSRDDLLIIRPTLERIKADMLARGMVTAEELEENSIGR